MMHLRNRFRSLWIAAAAASLAACGAPESIFLLEVDHAELPADGQSSTRLIIYVEFDGQPVDNARVSLTASAGGFGDRQDATTRLTTVGGEAITTYHAPYAVGDVTITAAYTDPYRQQQETQLNLQVVPPPPIDGATFQFRCAATNLRRPRASDDPLRLPCTVDARDVNGRTVEVDDVRFGFMAETGRLEINDRTGELEWILAPGERPKRVEPLGDAATGEPRYFDQGAGVTRNPRDGIATLVVYTRGVPTGAQDPLQGEPFVDENDSGQWETGEPCRQLVDGICPGPDGGDEERYIWRWYKVMVTGPVSQVAPEQAEGFELWDTEPFPRQQIAIPRGTNTSIGLILLDENLNPIASHPGTSPDVVRLSSSPHSLALQPTQQQLLDDRTGLAFDPITGQIQAGNTRSGYLQDTFTYRFNITNNREVDDEDPPINWSITEVRVTRRPFPTLNTQVTEILDGHELPRGTLQ